MINGEFISIRGFCCDHHPCVMQLFGAFIYPWATLRSPTAMFKCPYRARVVTPLRSVAYFVFLIQFRIPHSELRIANYELRIPNYELRITKYELRIPHSELNNNSAFRIPNSELRIYLGSPRI